jgi:hypothetical protein
VPPPALSSKRDGDLGDFVAGPNLLPRKAVKAPIVAFPFLPPTRGGL